jgi:hypothetical protein
MPTLPQVPTGLTSATSFIQFYGLAQTDYSGLLNCAAQNSTAERDTCYKTLAANQDDVSLCARISDSLDQERCVLIIAQETGNPALCANLPTLSDECYISVVSVTGDGDICKTLKNQSLAGACANATAMGQQTVDQERQAEAQFNSLKNCAVDSDCRAAGSANQFCIPKNYTGAIPNESSAFDACFENLSCGCDAGFCGFNKTDAYYGCVDTVENQQLQAWIDSMAANTTANSTAANVTVLNISG